MSADRTFCAAQLNRISRLRGAPDPGEKDGQVYAEEVLKALCESALSNQQAREFVDEIVRKSQWFPTPAEIYAMAPSREPEQWRPTLEYKCQLCLDSGFESFQRIVDGVPYDYARRCNCRSGAIHQQPEPDRRTASAEPEAARAILARSSK